MFVCLCVCGCGCGCECAYSSPAMWECQLFFCIARTARNALYLKPQCGIACHVFLYAFLLRLLAHAHFYCCVDWGCRAAPKLTRTPDLYMSWPYSHCRLLYYRRWCSPKKNFATRPFPLLLGIRYSSSIREIDPYWDSPWCPG